VIGQSRLRLQTVATVSALQVREVRHPAMAKESDSTSARGYGKPGDSDGDGRVLRKDDDFPLRPRRT